MTYFFINKHTLIRFLIEMVSEEIQTKVFILVSFHVMLWKQGFYLYIILLSKVHACCTRMRDNE